MLSQTIWLPRLLCTKIRAYLISALPAYTADQSFFGSQLKTYVCAGTSQAQPGYLDTVSASLWGTCDEVLCSQVSEILHGPEASD